jgi:hypothetical protein
MTDCTSQVAGFSIFLFIYNDYNEWGKNYDVVLRNASVLQDIQKTTDLHRKYAHLLRGRYALSVLTFPKASPIYL